MPELTMTLLNADNVDAVYEIEKSSFAIPWSHEAFVREATENQCARYTVLLEDGVPVAYAGVWFVLDEGHITNVAVAERCRGKGYGQMTLKALIQLAADSGMSFMTLEVRRSNAVAQNLYHKLGFVDVGYRKRYYADNQEDALVMVLEHMPEAHPENDPFLAEEE